MAPTARTGIIKRDFLSRRENDERAARMTSKQEISKGNSKKSLPSARLVPALSETDMEKPMSAVTKTYHTTFLSS